MSSPAHTNVTMPTLTYKQRTAIKSHWSPRVARAICRSIYPDFRGNYDQNLHMLAKRAAESRDPTLLPGNEGFTSYAREAREKGALFLWPYHYTDTRVCNPSHYLYYILNWERAQVNALLATPRRLSERLNATMLKEAKRLTDVYHALCDEHKPGIKGAQERRRGLNAVVKAKLMLSYENARTYEREVYGWDR